MYPIGYKSQNPDQASSDAVSGLSSQGIKLSEDRQLRHSLQEKSTGYFLLWGIPELADSIETRFNNRLRTTLGRAYVRSRNVQLNPLLLHSDIKLLDEVLCHELAHIVVYVRFGRRAKPHGSEWASLMRQAGFTPRARINIEEERIPVIIKTYEHLCPVCQITRYARRPVYRWRCMRCYKAGLGGHLTVRRVDKV